MAPKDIHPKPAPNTEGSPPPARPPLESSLSRAAVDGCLEASTHTQDYYLHIVESYGIKWNVEKCGRDVFQNFFDAQGGTLDGVTTEIVKEVASSGTSTVLHISGNQPFSYKELLHIGATTKRPGEFTAGGFGEGAKMLALSLLRDHGAERIVFRSQDWQLDFSLDDVPESLTDRPQRGLFAHVITGLPHLEGSAVAIASPKPKLLDEIERTKHLFKSSENLDFQDMTLEKTLADGTQVSIKVLSPEYNSSGKKELSHGNLYVAGQLRHYSTVNNTGAWNTVPGLVISISRDIATGDRDRGCIYPYQIKPIVKDFTETLDTDEVNRLFKACEQIYEISGTDTSAPITTLLLSLSNRAASLGVAIDFAPQFISVATAKDKEKRLVLDLIKQADLVACPDFFAKAGMRTDAEFVRRLHEHAELVPSEEQLMRIDMLQQAITALNQAGMHTKHIWSLPIKLYSKIEEKNPSKGSFARENVWLAVEALNASSFADVLATVVHENDHRFGSDESASFSYALTNTISSIFAAIISDPTLYEVFSKLSSTWSESQTREHAEHKDFDTITAITDILKNLPEYNREPPSLTDDTGVYPRWLDHLRDIY